MTKDEAYEEIIKIVDDRNRKSAEIATKAKANGSWESGLDSNKRLFSELDKTARERIQKVIDMIDE